MAARLRSHVRGNVIGYLALFVALSGSAYAATAAKKNSVVSKSIKNGQVRSVDLKDNGVAGVDLQDNGVQSVDIQDGGVQGVDLAPGSVDATSLAASAIGAPGFAKVASGGNVIDGRGVASVQHNMGSGTYCITMTFTPHVAVATVDAALGGTSTAQVQFPGGPAGAGCNANEIAVVTTDGLPQTFYLIVN